MGPHRIYYLRAGALDLVPVSHAIANQSPIEAALRWIAEEPKRIKVVQQTMLPTRGKVDVPRVLGSRIVCSYFPTRGLLLQRFGVCSALC